MKRAVLLLALTTQAHAALNGDPSPDQKKFFEEKIAPVLSDSCFKCHSQSEGKTKGGLALDSKEAIIKGGEDGAIIDPANPAKSMLIERLLSKDPEEKMPPKDASLTPQQIADLTAWVKMGAPYSQMDNGKGAIAAHDTSAGRKHWAWQPVRQPAVPAVKNPSWARTPVDNFILAKLEAQQMAPSATADRATLIRRAYFDLIGLPPMPWEVEAFIKDTAPNAWEKVIDRLLASPQYGERWGRYWLDVARYSDTKGEAKKQDSPVYVDAWTYRDYVIDSFNQDKPYDRFIVEQIAADRLNLGQDKRPLAALGFLTLGDRFNNNKNDIINDRIDVVTKGFLGLTVSCARCHDHMFDPIPQKDYYSLHGIFASSVEPKDNPVISAQVDSAQYREYMKAREAALKEAKDFAEDVFTGIQRVFREHAGDFLMAAASEGAARTEYARKLGERPRELDEMFKYFRRGNGLLRRSGIFSAWDRFTALNSSEFSSKAPAIAAEIAKGGTARAPIHPAIAAAFKGKSPASLEDVAGYYDEVFKEVTHRLAAEKAASTPAPNQQPSVLPPAKPVLPPLSSLKSASKAVNLVGAAPSSQATPPAPAESNGLSDAEFASLRYAPFPRDPMQNFDPEEDTRMLPQKSQNKIKQLLQAVDLIDLTHPGAPKRAMAIEDAPKPVNSPVFIRGEANNRGELVPHRFLEILSGPNRTEFKNGSGRLDLAEAIASRTNPLTARVMVNRIWLHHFGEGLVSTPDDFGTMSAAPTHPELLDYLATRFMQSGWSIKAMHKLIMTSAAYQQLSETNDRYAAKDPNNQLLWRFNIRRLDFEAVRDSLLYIAGKLDATVGGQPANILSEPYSYRRSVYGYIDRANLPEMMNHFDFANPGMPMGKRHETTVPQQALFMMNSPLMVDVARRLLDRPEMKPAKNDEEKIHALYWMIYQRPPKDEEKKLGLAFIQSTGESEMAEAAPEPATAGPGGRRAQRRGLKNAPVVKKPLPGKRGVFALDNKGDMVERKPLTVWEKYTHALLMANETIYFN